MFVVFGVCYGRVYGVVGCFGVKYVVCSYI